MNKDFELHICTHFFNKRSRERIYHELSTPKKRREFFHKMSHTAENYLSDCIADFFKMPPEPESIAKFLTSGQCYFITQDDLDGQFIDPKTALETLYRCGSPYMAVNSQCTKAYLETEYDFSEHTAYFLKIRKE